MGFVSTLLGTFVFGIGVPVGVLVGYYLFIYFHATDVKVVINAPFWYYALNAILSPFLTQRTKSKFVVVRRANVTETLLKYIPVEAIPTHYGGLKRENDDEFSMVQARVLELTIKAATSATIEIPALETGTSIWDFVVVGWEVKYTAEFVPADEGSYTIIVQKEKRMSAQEEPIRSSFRNNEPNIIVQMGKELDAILDQPEVALAKSCISKDVFVSYLISNVK